MIVLERNGEPLAYDIRPAMKKYGDIDYIYHAWLLAHKMSPEWDMPGVVDQEYYHYTHRKLDEIIPRASKNGSLYVCHPQGAEGVVRGFMCAEAFKDFPPIIHWVQVKKKDKMQGVATAMLKQFFLDFDLGKPDTLVYTFSSYDIKKKKRLRAAIEREGIKLVYLPDLKTTLNEPGWEA